MTERDLLAATGGSCSRCLELSGRVSRLADRVIRERLRRQEAERYVDHYADAVLTDGLTSLATRTRFLDDLELALQRAPRRGLPVGVLVADIDGFRALTCGHARPDVDALVREVGRRLVAAAGAEAIVARLGSDVFGVLVPQVEGAAGLRRFAGTVVAALAVPFALGAEDVRVTCSIGLRTAAAGEHAEGVLREAEAALFVAKSGAGPRITLFDSQPSRRSEERTFEVSLREAMRTGAMEAWYQPVLDLASLTVVGAEALVRWQHPARGQIPPAAFIDRAEDAGLVGLLTDHVLGLACAQAARWNSLPGTQPLMVHVNVSGHDLSDPTLERRVARALERSQADPAHLCLEITERALVTEAAVAQASLEALRQRGVRFAIDDFGVEYASFAYLRRFPVEILKIDRSFIERLATEARDRAVLSGIVAMARALGMRTVAEGVETPEQLEVLRDAGVDEAQGWLFGRAQPAASWPGRPDVAALP